MSNFLCPGSMVDHGWSWFSPFLSLPPFGTVCFPTRFRKKKRKRKTPWGLHSFNTHTMRHLRRPIRTNLSPESLDGQHPRPLPIHSPASRFLVLSDFWMVLKNPRLSFSIRVLSYAPKMNKSIIKSSKTKNRIYCNHFHHRFWGGLQSWAMPKNMTSHPLSFQLLELWMMENFESKMPRIQWLQPSVIGNGTSLHQIQPEIATPSQHVPLDLPVEPDRLPQQKHIEK